MPSQPATAFFPKRVVRFISLDQLAPYIQDWDRLSQGNPFRSWSWLSAWWRHYGGLPSGGRTVDRLFVIGVFDDSGRLIGAAPWYVNGSTWQGRVVRFLGTGEVCSEYLGVLAAPGLEEPVTTALADWLSSARGRDTWDLLELTGVSTDDAVVARLAAQLARRGNRVHRRAGPCCWRIELPDTWDQYLAMLSKQHRNHLRRAERQLVASGRAVVHWVREREDLSKARQVLVEQHQSRRNLLGQSGCFASARFTAFHCEAMPELLQRRQLGLFWIELDGRPFVTEYMLFADQAAYLYQGGMDTSRLDDSPGRLGSLTCLKFAIEHGYRIFDFLRGDEPYKAHFRAQPHGCLEIRVAADRLAAKVRQGVWLAGATVKPWLTAKRMRASSDAKLPRAPAGSKASAPCGGALPSVDQPIEVVTAGQAADRGS